MVTPRKKPGEGFMEQARTRRASMAKLAEEMRKQGMTQAVIAEKLGTSRTNLRDIREQAGAPNLRPGYERRELKAERLLREGLKNADVVEETGLSLREVGELRTKLNLPKANVVRSHNKAREALPFLEDGATYGEAARSTKVNPRILANLYPQFKKSQEETSALTYSLIEISRRAKHNQEIVRELARLDTYKGNE